MASRFLTLALLALAVLTQLAAGAVRARSRDACQAPRPDRVTAYARASLVDQPLAGARRDYRLDSADDPGSEYRDCFAIEDSDETSSSGGRPEGTRKAGEGWDDPANVPASGLPRTDGHCTSVSHPLIYQLCTLLI